MAPATPREARAHSSLIAAASGGRQLVAEAEHGQPLLERVVGDLVDGHRRMDRRGPVLERRHVHVAEPRDRVSPRREPCQKGGRRPRRDFERRRHPGGSEEGLELIELIVVEVVERHADAAVDVATRTERGECAARKHDGVSWSPRLSMNAAAVAKVTRADEDSMRRISPGSKFTRRSLRVRDPAPLGGWA